MNKLPLALSLLTALSCRPSTVPVAPVSVGIPQSGIPQDLARHRAATLTDVRYHLELEIPRSRAESIVGKGTLILHRRADAGPLVIDFAPGQENVLEVRVRTASSPESAGEAPTEATDYRVENGHIVVPEEHLLVGENTIEIKFRAGDSSLNRRENFLYTLFVPDRAHHAVPCFDQPDLKARFTITLETPEDWRAVAVAELEEREVNEGRARWSFAESAPIPTYLLAFAAGEFEVETAERDGRTLRFFHRETDAEKVVRNREALFDLHGAALAWLEDYTAIDYPFNKLDFVLIPGFQYGGMEHPESIFYRDASLLLDESATQSDFLGRASLIAHEVAHMWFGDLVTMTWFNDVWMKEVFANFMAAKIVHPSFPEINHELSFVIRHFPSAYEVDRSQGANPIRQELANLNEAGSLYGAIIYQKAPIVMRHLELLMGEDELRDGLREYLDQHRYGNASWPDLVATLEPRTEIDLASWSRVWVGEPGRPEIRVEWELEEAGIKYFRVLQSDPWGRGRTWNQRLSWLVGGASGVRRLEAHLMEGSTDVAEAQGWPAPEYILPAGLGYGEFVLDPPSRRFLLADIATLEDPVPRGLAWLTLWDEMLAGRVTPEELFDTAQSWLESETETQLVEQVLGQLPGLYWRYLDADARARRAVGLEGLLWSRLEAAPSASLKSSYFKAYRSVATSEPALGRLIEIWRGDGSIPGLPQSEDDLMTLALELAARQVPEGASILEGQLERIENPDRRRRFAFVMPALSADPEVRAGFFDGLKEVANREQERWVLEGLTYLNHPLRAEASRIYMLPALEMLEEIQRTGDIFFPKRWLDAALGGHASPEAAEIVRSFLSRRPDYPPRLRGKILQSADELFRAAELQGS